jgi:hypothetical protein
VTGSREERPPYRVASLDGLDRVPLQEGVWRPVRRALGATAFGGHEELYVVLRGAAEFTVGGDPVNAPAGTMVLVEPAVMRSAVATEAGTTVLVVGGRPGAALPPSPFEYWYAAIPAHEAGDHERALAIVTEGLEHHPDHGTIHYAIACELALLGRRSDALEHLRTAFANDPRTRGWAAEEPDLDALRDDPLLSGR